MPETTLTVVGNLTADPELRYTQGGVAVANFTIAATPRIFNRQTNEYEDGEALFMRCSAWRQFGENIAGSLLKGMRVVATGKLKQRSYDDRDGQKRTSIELEVDEIGPSLRYATSQVTRVGSERGAAAVEAAGWKESASVPSAPRGGDDWDQPTLTETPF